MRYLWPLVFASVAACGSDSIPSPPVGEILGHVEISTDVPAGSCVVLLEGVPIGSHCDQDGGFDLRNVPAGRWDLRILPDATQQLPARRIVVGANGGFVSDLGAIQLSPPGSVGGHVKADDSTLAVSYVAVPELGAVTVPNAGGGYLLEAVAPGAREVVLIGPTGSVTNQRVVVVPQKTTIDVNFDAGQAQNSAFSVIGQATRADGSSGGLRVQLVSAIDGSVVQHATPGADGGFSVTAPPGAYVVRVSDGSNPATAIIPSVIVGDHDVTLGSTLVVPPQHGDLDGDGVADDQDDDIDGDGVPNSIDAFPYNPAETLDTDGDGLGDRADLSSNGNGVDTHNPTPDTDGDGKLDFEDNCPTVPNPDQADADHDGIGDACDSCPLVPNPDQTGVCVQCLTDDQCGNLVCVSNQCEPCTSTTQCNNGHTCNLAIGACVQCVTDPDCGSGRACLDGVCVTACTSDTQCAGAFCVSGKCQQCRGPADCPLNEYCDSGACRPQCTTAADCANGHVCDVPTGTCVVACNGTCTGGQTCVSGVCRQRCDGSQPCPSGENCDSTGACKAQCTVNGDCAGTPHTLCSAGACVPDGTCSFDADCPASEMCIAGACLARATTFDPGQGYECSSACDCRQGETCDGTNHCVNDVVAFGDGTVRVLTPTFWAQAGASGDGSSPATPGNPAVGFARVAAGNGTVLALRAGDSLSLTGPLTLAQGDVAIAGGYHVCAANRWVRDAALRTSVASAQTGVIAAFGDTGVPRPHVALLGLAMSTTDTNFMHRRVFIDATYAPSLFIADSSFAPVLTTTDPGAYYYASVACDHCDNATLKDSTIGGASSPIPTSITDHGVSITTGSGTFSNLQIGGIDGVTLYVGLEVQTTTGPVTVDKVQLAGTGAGGGFGMVTTCGVDSTGTSYPLAISNTTIGWNDENAGTSANGSPWYGLQLQRCDTSTVHDVLVDGSTVTDATGNGREGIVLLDSSGTFTNVGVILPDVTGGTSFTYGFDIRGPRGSYVMSKPSVAGSGGNGDVALLLLTNVSQGVVAIDHGTFSNISGNTVVGISATNSGGPGTPALTMTDSTVTAAGSAGVSYAIALSTASARVERSTLISTGGQSQNITVSADASSAIELYESLVFAGAPATNGNAQAIAITNNSQLTATGDTFDGNGSLQANVTSGFTCDNTSTAKMSSCLVSGGLGIHQLMVWALGGGNSCLVPTQFDHNYFWYPKQSPHDGFDQISVVASAAVGTADTRGNIVNDNATCYDSAFSLPTYQIAAGSRCVNAGVVGTRRDGSVPTLDITSATRTLGSAADIGCFEKQ